MDGCLYQGLQMRILGILPEPHLRLDTNADEKAGRW